MGEGTARDVATLRAAIERIERAEGIGADGFTVGKPNQSSSPRSDPAGVARAIVLRQLSQAPRTRSQLLATLLRRGCVLDRFTEVGLIDDAAYAELYVRSKQASRSLAKPALRRELRTKGVDPQTAADVLDAVSDADEEERARALVRSRIARLHGLDRCVQVRRLAALLARKGYPSALAARVVFEELDRSAEHARD